MEAWNDAKHQGIARKSFGINQAGSWGGRQVQRHGSRGARGGQGWLVCLPRRGLISLNPDARLSPRLFSSVQGTSRQMGAHGNACHCARVRPAMQMILQALARDSWSLCGFIHLTPGRPGRGGPACVFRAGELSAL